MSLLSTTDVLNLKLNSIPLQYIKVLAQEMGISEQSSASEIIKKILEKYPSPKIIDNFIKQKYYFEKIQHRKKEISDDDLKRELSKVKTFSWGVIQGQLDQKIQSQYVRKFYYYNELIENVKDRLHNEITNYVICSWFNHWTTVLIEEHISLHPKVIPTIKNIKGLDIFFEDQPFDLKVTYPKKYIEKYGVNKLIENQKDLAVWMYENQGSQRFGSDNRLFIIVLDKENPDRSWELKRDFDLIFKNIDNFFDNEKISQNDEIIFTYRKKTYTTITKVLLITK